MKMFKLVPQLRENCVVKGAQSVISNFQVGDVVFLISNTPTKKFSIISKIEAKHEAKDPKIIIDKRRLGKFAENDEVFLLKYNAAEALEVQLTISNEYTAISEGNWTASIKPSLKNKLVDSGQEVSFLIEWEGGAPIVGTGIIEHTLPNPPVYIADRTKILINKESQENLSAIKARKLNEQSQRVDVLVQEQEQEKFKLVNELRQKAFSNKGQKYKFKATNPQKLFDSIINIFSGLEVIENPNAKVYDEQQQEYLASAVFLRKKSEAFQIIDIQVVASGNSGSLIIWVTGDDEVRNQEILKYYDDTIKQLKHSLEERVQVLEITCPECGGDLPTRQIDINGKVECPFCKTISRIPKALRY